MSQVNRRRCEEAPGGSGIRGFCLLKHSRSDREGRKPNGSFEVIQRFLKGNMNATAKFIRRDISDVKPWIETCGLIRPLIEESHGAAAEVHHLEITDAKLHYHVRTDEIYYILGGHGRMALDDSEIELHEGVVVYVPRGVKHRAWGDLKALVICIPGGVLHDVHEI